MEPAKLASSRGILFEGFLPTKLPTGSGFVESLWSEIAEKIPGGDET